MPGFFNLWSDNVYTKQHWLQRHGLLPQSCIIYWSVSRQSGFHAFFAYLQVSNVLAVAWPACALRCYPVSYRKQCSIIRFCFLCCHSWFYMFLSYLQCSFWPESSGTYRMKICVLTDALPSCLHLAFPATCLAGKRISQTNFNPRRREKQKVFGAEAHISRCKPKWRTVHQKKTDLRVISRLHPKP